MLYRLAEEANKQGIDLHEDTYNAILRSYANAGDLPDCDRVMEEMRKKNLKAHQSTSEALHNARSSGGKGSLLGTLVDEMLESQ